jgi:glycosyltransferase involved in cell wall biosynthesis
MARDSVGAAGPLSRVGRSMARILIVVRPSKGGAFGHVVRLGHALADRGHEVAVCGPHGHHGEALGLELVELEIGRSAAPGNGARAALEMGRILRRRRPDLVHAHGSQGGAIARLGRWGAPRIPVAFSPHNYAFANAFSSSAHNAAYRGIEIALGPLATRVICVCEWEARLAAGIGCGRRARVVYNGIDPIADPAPDAELAALAAAGPLLACVTEFHLPKGVPTLIEAMPAVLAAHPDATLLVAGEGPMRPQIEGLISTLGIERSVRLLGQIPDVAPLLAGAHVFAAPGWAESFPYAILEAMGAASAIVATDVGGVGEAIVDGITGRLVPPRDPGALATALIDLIGDPARARSLGEAARRRLIERFSFTGMVEGTLAVYREIAAV